MNKKQFAATLQACFFGDNNAYKSIIKEYDKLKNNEKEIIKLADSYNLGKYDYKIPVFVINEKLKEFKKRGRMSGKIKKENK